MVRLLRGVAAGGRGLVVLMPILCPADAALRMLRAQRVLDVHTAARADATG